MSDGIRAGLISAYSLPSPRIEVIPNGANVSRFHPMDRDSNRLALRLGRQDFIVCFVGNLVSWQGIPTLIRAAELLVARIPHLRILVVGGGPDLVALKALATRSVAGDACLFTGEVPYEDVPAIIAASDVCVAPLAGTRKASPIKVFEYLACARPVISSDIEGLGEFLKTTGAGLVVEPDNPTALANSIEWVYSHPVEALEITRRGRNVVEQSRSWKDTARKVSDILQTVRKKPPLGIDDPLI